MLTKNIQEMIASAEMHVRQDQLANGSFYWDDFKQKGCFIGCYTHSDGAEGAEAVTELYGIPEPLVWVCDFIQESLRIWSAKEADQFHMDIPCAIGVDGRDLSRVQWQFLHRVLLRLPVKGPEIYGITKRIGKIAKSGECPAQDPERAGWIAGAARGVRDAISDAGDAAKHVHQVTAFVAARISPEDHGETKVQCWQSLGHPWFAETRQQAADILELIVNAPDGGAAHSPCDT